MRNPAFESCLTYVEENLRDCIRARRNDQGTLIGLPNPYIVPNSEMFEEMYYWDSYFTTLGLIELGWFELVKGMTENCLYLIERFGFVPNANRTYYLTRSQPPFITSMIGEVYSQEKDEVWLRKALGNAEREYKHYWNVVPHLVPEIGLNRYFDKSEQHQHAEDESGWDLTPRFLTRGNDFCPICLNCYLYKYESDFSEYYAVLDNKDASEEWKKLAESRKELINRYMWDEKEGLFFDFDFRNRKKSHVKSLASYIPLWCNLATNEQAEKLLKNLTLFEYPGGLATCDQNYGMPERQWNFPNGWPPLQWLIIIGLKNYGYDERANTIRSKWIALCAEVFKETGYFWEKYDVVNTGIGSSDVRYKTQKGFSWTNAIFLALYNLELG